jgi:hypothetical protein
MRQLSAGSALVQQIAMIAGFLVTWPVNAWLIRRGVKEKM